MRPFWKVYVSGFLDWPVDMSEAVGFNEWRCKRNPSGYLFIGGFYDPEIEVPTKQDPTQGSLPRKLRSITETRDGRAIKWTFDLLPVCWGVAHGIVATDYDVVVNLGVGVYPSRFGPGFETILLLEEGARNRRSGGTDVDGISIGDEVAPAAKIDANAGSTLTAPAQIRRRIRSAAGNITAGTTAFTVLADPARDTNVFVCNETHYIMLSQADPSRRLRQAYFIHIPKPSNMHGGRPLAFALKALIEDLIQP